jgi:hypothetical protein
MNCLSFVNTWIHPQPHELEADIVDIPTADHNYPGINNMYSQTCIKMSPLRQGKRGLIRQLTS